MTRDSRLPNISPAVALDFKQNRFKFALVGARTRGAFQNIGRGVKQRLAARLERSQRAVGILRQRTLSHGSVAAHDEHVVVGDRAEGLVLLDHRLIRLASLESAILAGLVS